MTEAVTVNLGFMSRDLKLSSESIQKVIDLFEQGFPVPFIARYRKDQTGNLDEEKLRRIAALFEEQKKLVQRKQSILRSIEALGLLTPELERRIIDARTNRRLEDIYLPYKPQKQTLAASAREKGLEPFAEEILKGSVTDLNQRACELINSEKDLNTAEDVLKNAGYIISDQFANDVELRQRIRELFRRQGKLVTQAVEKKNEKKEEVEAAVTVSKNSTESDVSETVSAVTELPSDSVTEQVEAPVIDAVTEIVPAADPQAVDQNVTEETDHVAAENAGEVTATVAADLTHLAENQTAENVQQPDSETFTETSAPETGAAVTAPAPKKDAKADKNKNQKKKDKKSEKEQEEERIRNLYRDYFDFSIDIRSCPSHRTLAISRAEKAGIIRVRLDLPAERITAAARDMMLSKEDLPNKEFLSGCLDDALARLLVPSMEREIRRELQDKAEEQSVQVFAKNLRNLLLQKPLLRRRVLALDPGFRHGCKLAALDEFGNVLAHDTVFTTGGAERRKKAAAKITDLINKYNLSIIAIGNGTGCREAEQFISEILTSDYADKDVAYIIVNEAGASVYSVSPLAKEEFPDYNPLIRGAISIGRRLQDALNELVKIDPGNLGIGMYQHDLKNKTLKDALSTVVESCVNHVGVDLNSATPAILRYVSGLNQLTALRIYEYRVANGPFRKREQLLGVPGIGAASYTHAAGFLRLPDGFEPLDSTWIHPESYDLARSILEKIGFTPDDLKKPDRKVLLDQKLKELDPKALAEEFQTGVLTITDILEQFTRPGRDPRTDLPTPIFKKGVLKLEDLKVGMELTGTVLNVVDFGAFIDIGLHQSGLVHISQLGDQYVKDAHQSVSVGDVVKVWVVEVDLERNRLSLTMIEPGTERPKRQDRPHRDNRNRVKEETGSENRPTENHSDAPRRSDRPDDNAQNYRRDDRRGDRRGDGRRNDDRGNDDRKSDDRRGSFRRDDRRPNREGGRNFNDRNDNRRGGSNEEYRPVRVFQGQPKKAKPISDAMRSGREPMRSFGDLAQFFHLKPEDETKPENENNTGNKIDPENKNKPEENAAEIK